MDLGQQARGGQMLLWLQFHRSVWPRQAAREWRARGAELPSCDLSQRSKPADERCHNGQFRILCGAFNKIEHTRSGTKDMALQAI